MDLLRKPYMSTFKREVVLESVRYYRTIFDWDFVIEEKDYERGHEGLDARPRWTSPSRTRRRWTCASSGRRRPSSSRSPVTARASASPSGTSRRPSTQGAREVPAVSPRVLRRPRSGVRGDRRSLRLRQVHHPQHDRRPRAPSSGGRSWWTASRSAARRRRQVGYVFQKDTVFPWRTVERNIALGLEYRGVPAAERARRVEEAIALAGLQGFEDAFPPRSPAACASGSRSCARWWSDPEILLMDEPFGALDTHTKLNLHAELLAPLGGPAADRGLRHPRPLRGHHPGRPHRGDDATAGARSSSIYDVKLPRPRDVIRIRESDGVPARVRRDLARPRRGIPGATP